MKQYARILLLLVIVFFLCSCGHQPGDGSTTSSSNDNPVFSGKKSEPSNEQLHTDMQDSLTLYHSGNYGYNVSICEYEVERSLTEDTSYTARFKVIAQSTYADFHYTANVEYTRYDQGWMIDQCDWTLATYEVTRYPNEEEIQLMKEQQGVQYSTELKVVTEGERLVYYGKMISQWNQFIITEYDISVAWVFDLYSDSWLFESQTSNDEKFEFTKSLEGTWNLSEEDYLSKGSIVISNVDGSAFDMQLITEHYSTEVFHVDIDNCNWDINEDWFLTLHWEDSAITYDEEVGTVYLNISFYKSAHLLNGQSYTSRWLIYVGPNYKYTSSAYI